MLLGKIFCKICLKIRFFLLQNLIFYYCYDNISFQLFGIVYRNTMYICIYTYTQLFCDYNHFYRYLDNMSTSIYSISLWIKIDFNCYKSKHAIQ